MMLSENDPDDVSWMAYGLCAQTDPEMFFPEQGRSGGLARAICRRCQVRRQCLAYALNHPELQGIWGGTSQQERQRMRAEMRARAGNKEKEMAP